MNKRRLLKTLVVATMVCAFTTLAGDGAAVRGNPKSKVYHLPACKHYNAKGSTVEFKSVTEAQKAGYKPCKICGKTKAEKSSKKK
jgi:methylphosphotriester-DNA--protein-cysteine methyltransferase